MPDIMMWIVVLGCVAAIAAVLLAIAAALRYLFSRSHRGARRGRPSAPDSPS
jgi:hypothetical protein